MNRRLLVCGLLSSSWGCSTLPTTLWDLSIAGSYTLQRTGRQPAPEEARALEQLPVPARALPAFGAVRAQAPGYLIDIHPDTDNLGIVIKAERALSLDLRASSCQVHEVRIDLQQIRSATLFERQQESLGFWRKGSIPGRIDIPAGGRLSLSIDIKPMLPPAWMNQWRDRHSDFSNTIAGTPFAFEFQLESGGAAERLRIQGRVREARSRASYR